MSGGDDRAILAIYIEPTPYIVGLLDLVRGEWDGEIAIAFLGANQSQEWNLDLQPGSETIPGGVKGLVRIWNLISSKQPGIIHLAGWGHPLLLASMIVAYIRRIPVAIESDTPKPPLISRRKAFLKRLLYPVLFGIPARFLPGGSRQAAYLRSYGVSQDRISIAQMTVDTQAITEYVGKLTETKKQQIREDLGIETGTFVFLFVGRLEPHKGIECLLGAFEETCRDGGGADAQLLIVGDGSCRAMVETQAGVSERIICTGRLSGEPLLNSFAISHVLVVPSLFEPWGLVVNEALAAGLPVIATKAVGCSDDLIVEGETGIIVEPDCSCSLAEAMHTLRSDLVAYQRMAECAQALIKDWSLENESNNIIHAWRKIESK